MGKELSQVAPQAGFFGHAQGVRPVTVEFEEAF
jgi:hypothetical protein